jgi:hypothetical protein
MPLTITHSFVSTKPDGNDDSLIRPSNWNATHAITGNIIESDLTLSDNTNNNVSNARHGFAPKLPNDAAVYLNGAGQWTTPSGNTPESPLTISVDPQDSTILNVSGGKAAIAAYSNTFDAAQFQLILLPITAISTANPAVFTVSSTQHLSVGMRVEVLGGTGTNLSFSNQKITIENVLSATTFTASLSGVPIDGTIMTYTGGAVMGGNLGTSSTANIIADMDNGNIVMIATPDSGVIVAPLSNSAVQYTNSYDFSLNGYGVYLGYVSLNGGIDNLGPSFSGPNNVYPAVSNNILTQPTGTGIVVRNVENQLTIHATGHGFFNTVNDTQDTNFWWDATNHRLGLGTVLPDHRLDVDGNINLTGNLLKNGSTYPFTVLNGTPVGNATGAVIYRDATGIWVGMADGGWGRILFDSVTPPV